MAANVFGRLVHRWRTQRCRLLHARARRDVTSHRTATAT